MTKAIGPTNMTKGLVMCRKCKIPAHAGAPTKSNRQIHDLEQFKGLSCFAILHSDEGNSIWIRKPEGHEVRYSVNFANPIVQDLRDHYGLARRATRQCRNSVGSDEE